MHSLRWPLAALSLVACATPPLAAQPHPRVSPHETISSVIDGNRVTVVYGRPYTKDPKTGAPRTIWGGLVPYGKVWRTGADEATLFLTQKTLTVGGVTIPAGAYTLYTLPEADGSAKLIFSKEVGEWGTQYNAADDFARVDLKKETLAAPLDQFTMTLAKGAASGGVLSLLWENTGYSVAFAVQGARLEFPDASPASTLKQRIGLTDIEVTYARPGMKGRVIFGGLVPYDEVWRTGANSATKISFSTPVKLEGTPVPAGTYELFTIPGREEWTVIIHKDMSEWGAYTYDPKNDVARVKVVPFNLPVPLENFTITFNHLSDQSGLLELAWEKTLVPVKIEVNTVAALVPRIEAAMAGPGRKPYFQAAMFYYDNNLDLKQAAAWMDEAIAANPNAYYMTYRKALILAKAGDKAGAIAAAQHSIELASKDSGSEKSEYLRLNEALLARLR